MKHAPQYYLARYIADPIRREPRNIGIGVWADGAVCSNFATPAEAEIVVDEGVYKRWIDMWQELFFQTKIEDINGKSYTVKTPNFMKALSSYASDAFTWEYGGEFIDIVRKEDISVACNQLFRELVLPVNSGLLEDRNISFSKTCDDLLSEAGYKDRDDFKTNYKLALSVEGLEQHWSYDYALADEKHPGVLILRVPSNDRAISSFTKFHEAIQKKLVNQKQCASFIQMDDKSSLNAELHQLLKTVSIPINTLNQDKAIYQLEELKKSAA